MSEMTRGGITFGPFSPEQKADLLRALAEDRGPLVFVGRDEEHQRLRRRVATLEGRLARVCAYAESASYAECVKHYRGDFARFNSGGQVWSSRRAGTAGKGTRT